MLDFVIDSLAVGLLFRLGVERLTLTAGPMAAPTTLSVDRLLLVRGAGAADCLGPEIRSWRLAWARLLFSARSALLKRGPRPRYADRLLLGPTGWCGFSCGVGHPVFGDLAWAKTRRWVVGTPTTRHVNRSVAGICEGRDRIPRGSPIQRRPGLSGRLWV